MPDARSYQERDSSAAKAGEGCGKREGAGATFRRVLLGQPESIDSEVGAAQTEKEQTKEKPGKSDGSEIEDLAEGERDEHHHQRKKTASAPRRPSLSAIHGIARQPRMVANETSM